MEPCCPLAGFTSVIDGAAVTVNPLVSVAVSPPVVTCTLRAPSAAPLEMETLAVALVALFTVRLFTVMPAPKVAIDVPCRKCVKLPVIDTGTQLEP